MNVSIAIPEMYLLQPNNVRRRSINNLLEHVRDDYRFSSKLYVTICMFLDLARDQRTI